MRVERVNLDELSAKSLDLGFVGEQNHTKIIISCVMMFSDYPDAVATMVVNPPVGDIYPVQLTRSGNKLEWNVSASDLAYAGSGSYQLTFTENEEIIKVEYGSYFVKPSMTSTGEPPTPIEDWMQEATGALEALEEISASASTLAAGSSATAQITTVEGHKNIAIGIPKGDKGDTGDTGAEGYSPTATVSKSGTTATITITDKTGTTTATVTDGVATDAQVTNAVDTYLAANFSNPSNPPLDRTLASSSSAAPADLMGDLSKAVDKTAYSETIDYTTSNVTSYYISPSDGYWKNSSGYCCGFYPVPENAYKVRVEANANYNGVIALLKSTDHTKNTLPDYATGESGLRMTSTGTTAEYAIPDDCGYIYVYLYNASGANNRRPTSTKIFYFVKAQQIDNTLMVEGDAADAKAAGQAIKNVRSLSEDTLSFAIPVL